MGFKIVNISPKVQELEGTFSKDALYNNGEHCFYALDASLHENDGFPLVQVYEDIGSFITRVSQLTYLTLKNLDTIYYYPNDETVLFSFRINSMVDLNIELLSKCDFLDKIRFEKDGIVNFYFFMQD